MPLQSLIPVSDSIEDVFDKITATGVSKVDAATLVGNWIVATAGQGVRIFNYTTDFPRPTRPPRPSSRAASSTRTGSTART